MGRPLPSTGLPMQRLSFLPAPVTFFIILTAVFSVFSVVSFLCGSHHKGMIKYLREAKEDKKKTVVRLGGENRKPVIEKMKSSLSSKALLMAKMISWRKVQDDGELEQEFDYYEEDEDGGAVWKKTIIKGEKCRPLDFSGKILYDSDGNLLPD